MQDVRKMACVVEGVASLKERALIEVGSWASQICLSQPKMRQEFDALLAKGESLPGSFFATCDTSTARAIAQAINKA